ncbi:MAG: hypothetical protein KatS3mg047_0257 [Bellilinea sp.]|nr:MAG: hypothetical protein KatS3mg047_0257 [Bellilinea sp.]
MSLDTVQVCYNDCMTVEPQPTSPEPATQPSSTVTEPVPSERPKENRRAAGIIAVVVGIVLLVIGGIVLLALAPESTTAKVRDIFIIVMALESLVLGVAVIVLIVQIATLINLLQNEIKPILDSTNETVNHLRGTTQFLSNNLVEPVMKLNEYLAGLRKLFDFIRPDRR